MEKGFIRYSFALPDGSKEILDLHLDPATLDIAEDLPANLPSWTKLEFHQCPNCPLTPGTHPYCPLAARLVPLVNRFDGLLSFDRVHVTVTTDERVVSLETSAQRAIGSLMGLVNAVSGCPHTAVFKPMARFHLPLASREETTYRATSMYLLAQYFLKREGKNVDLELDGLDEIYHNMQTINASIVKRIRSATGTDSLVNAVIVLDIYAKTLEIVINDSLAGIRHLFDAFFTGRRHDPPDGQTDAH